ncbi:cupredoxin domain-containing protein [Novispirillum itersonii]|uniref:Plastocyanin n=1 Tax=Novispirillum itersonii TaxID=189 RepID=A0A7W9ZG16_NOVIT|nr:cupredoxin domain-containing protein [Novispirillum itersonii]MBB6210818.1 plastocyanin [Novispirillum itersonii]
MRLLTTAVFAASVLAAPLLAAAPAQAEDPTYTLTIKDHVFEPSRVEVPANQKVTLLVKNLDTTPEEFESKSLRREKVIMGRKELAISIGPLKPGEYTFMGEYNADTAHGVVVAK